MRSRPCCTSVRNRARTARPSPQHWTRRVPSCVRPAARSALSYSAFDADLTQQRASVVAAPSDFSPSKHASNRTSPKGTFGPASRDHHFDAKPTAEVYKHADGSAVAAESSRTPAQIEAHHEALTSWHESSKRRKEELHDAHHSAFAVRGAAALEQSFRGKKTAGEEEAERKASAQQERMAALAEPRHVAPALGSPEREQRVMCAESLATGVHRFRSTMSPPPAEDHGAPLQAKLERSFSAKLQQRDGGEHARPLCLQTSAAPRCSDR